MNPAELWVRQTPPQLSLKWTDRQAKASSYDRSFTSGGGLVRGNQVPSRSSKDSLEEVGPEGEAGESGEH